MVLLWYLQILLCFWNSGFCVNVWLHEYLDSSSTSMFCLAFSSKCQGQQKSTWNIQATNIHNWICFRSKCWRMSWLYCSWVIHPEHKQRKYRCVGSCFSDCLSKICWPLWSSGGSLGLAMTNSTSLGGGFKYFLFSPLLFLEMIRFDVHIFQMDWFNLNHQLVVVVVVWKNHYRSDGEDSSNFMNPSDGSSELEPEDFPATIIPDALSLDKWLKSCAPFCTRIEHEICHTYLSPTIVLSDPILFVSKLSHPSMILSHPFQRLAPKTPGFSRWNGVMFTQSLHVWNISLHFRINS